MAGYGFIRDTSRWGPNSLPLALLRQRGITPLFQATDPNLALALANAGKAGLPTGIWLAAAADEDPRMYAQRLAALASRYNPSVIVPDIEFVGKGYKGSKGWDWNDVMFSMFRALAPKQRTGLTVMPNQEDFNYEAYLRRGVNLFLPQSYGETYATKFDPRQVVQTLIKRGVPASMIQPVLAPGQTYGGPSSYYALDDFGPTDFLARALVSQRTSPRLPVGYGWRPITGPPKPVAGSPWSRI